MNEELTRADIMLLDQVDLFVRRSKEDGVSRATAKGDIILLVNAAILLGYPTEAAGLRMKELVYTRFDQAWPA